MSDLRCAVAMQALGADPIGSAGFQDGWALVPSPLPWPADIGEIGALGPHRAALAAAPGRLRLQALVPTGPAAGADPVVLHRRGDRRPFAGYLRQEGPDLAALLATVPEAQGAERDVLICTHGRRDRCCGSLGTSLWQELAGGDLGVPGDDGALGGARLWRTSHTGGHRFAPTMVVLPEGTMWGYLDADLVRRIVGRQGPVADVLPHYRGCTGLATPQLQAVERSVLAEVGWDLLDLPRSGSDLGGGRWRLDVGDPDPQSWEAAVVEGASWPVPQCGEPLNGTQRHEHAWAVTDLRRTA